MTLFTGGHFALFVSSWITSRGLCPDGGNDDDDDMQLIQTEYSHFEQCSGDYSRLWLDELTRTTRLSLTGTERGQTRLFLARYRATGNPTAMSNDDHGRLAFHALNPKQRPRVLTLSLLLAICQNCPAKK